MSIRLFASKRNVTINNRGMLNDVEMNVAALDPTLARGLRMTLWAEHLGLYSEDELFDLAYFLGQQQQSCGDTVRGESIWQSVQEMLGDPHAGLRMMVNRAEDNLLRYKARQPLLGQLLPYLTAEEATQQGLKFREEHGWIEEE